MVTSDKLEELISRRKLLKKLMFRFPRNSKEFKELDEAQSTIKKEINMLYGER